MTDTQPKHPPLTQAEFEAGCGYRYRGVAICEDENGVWVYAYGHVQPPRFVKVLRDYDRETAGPTTADHRCPPTVEDGYCTCDGPERDPLLAASCGRRAHREAATPSAPTPDSDPTHGTSPAGPARATEAQVQAAARAFYDYSDFGRLWPAVADAVVAAGPVEGPCPALPAELDEVAILAGVADRMDEHAYDEVSCAMGGLIDRIDAAESERDSLRTEVERLGSLSEAYREHLEATTADWRRERLRAEAAEAESREAVAPPPCEEHIEVQHRDGRPPWCRRCGWRHARPGTLAQLVRLIEARDE